ncbi:MAG: PUA domain-containing protein [Candidatus Thorarchaeota archaeon]
MRQTNPKDVLLFFITPMGIVPWELEHVHPAQQCLFPTILDKTTISTVKDRLEQILKSMSVDKIFWVIRNTPTNEILETLSQLFNIETVPKVSDAIDLLGSSELEGTRWTKRKLEALFTFQWEVIPEILNSNEIVIKFSRKTGKIRQIQIGDEIIFTLVPTTGLLTPSFRGGLELLKAKIDKKYIVTMETDAAEFVVKGKSALAKFVKHAHPALRAGEEVLIVDEEDNLLATGRTLLTGLEMMTFERGVAVTNRHSMKR